MWAVATFCMLLVSCAPSNVNALEDARRELEQRIEDWVVDALGEVEYSTSSHRELCTFGSRGTRVVEVAVAAADGEIAAAALVDHMTSDLGGTVIGEVPMPGLDDGGGCRSTLPSPCQRPQCGNPRRDRLFTAPVSLGRINPRGLPATWLPFTCVVTYLVPG